MVNLALLAKQLRSEGPGLSKGTGEIYEYNEGMWDFGLVGRIEILWLLSIGMQRLNRDLVEVTKIMISFDKINMEK